MSRGDARVAPAAIRQSKQNGTDIVVTEAKGECEGWIGSGGPGVLKRSGTKLKIYSVYAIIK